MSQGQAFWEREDWDALPDSEKAAVMQAALNRLGYDPVESRHREEHRQLQAQIDQLKHDVRMLELALKRWVDNEAAAAKARLDEQRYQQR